MPVWFCHSRIARLVSSVPLSETPILLKGSFRFAVEPDASIQLAGNTGPGEGCISNKCQALTGVVVDHVEHAEAAGWSKDIGYKVEAPAL